jgi:hypothetical protein
VPVGTTAQRPSPADTGYLRFNTTTTDLEYAANSSTWYSITTQETLTSNNISVNNNITVGNSTVNTIITSTSVKTATVNTTAIYANGSYGTAGQVLTSNGTNIYWSTSIGYTGSAGSVGFTGSTGSIGYTGSSGTGGGGGGASVTVSATAPVSPANGDMWWNTEIGTLLIYYNDGDTSQWVGAIPTTGGGAGGGGSASSATVFGYNILFGGN